MLLIYGPYIYAAYVFYLTVKGYHVRFKKPVRAIMLDWISVIMLVTPVLSGIGENLGFFLIASVGAWILLLGRLIGFISDAELIGDITNRRVSPETDYSFRSGKEHIASNQELRRFKSPADTNVAPSDFHSQVMRELTYLKPIIEKDFDYAKCAVTEEFSDYSDMKFKFQIFLKAEYCFANFDFELFNVILKTTGEVHYTVRNSENGLCTNQKNLEKLDNLQELIKTALKVNLNE